MSDGSLARCVRAICASEGFEDGEVIVVDDGCAPAALRALADLPCEIVRNQGPRGPGSARNLGARQARGEILVFVDADVEVLPDTLARMRAALESDRVDAVFGAQAVRMEYRNFASQFKNLWMRYSYLQACEPSTFYTSCAAIRREVFERLCGFDARYAAEHVDMRQRERWLEDVEMGHRLRDNGCRVAMDPEIEFRHHRYYSLVDLLRTDGRRAYGLVKIFLNRRLSSRPTGRRQWSVPPSFIASVLLADAGLAAALVGVLLDKTYLAWCLAGCSIAGLWLNRGLLRAVDRVEGPCFAARAAFFLMADWLAATVGMARATLSYPFDRWN